MTNTTLSRRSFIASAGCLAVASGTSAAQRRTRPNIVFILADDLGFADLSVYGRREYRTPHIDSLAADGLRFTQAYSNSAVCSATRFALITGRYQYRFRGGLEEPIHRPNPAVGLHSSVPTLPSLLKQAGYDTALIGKWHLGFLPHYGPLKSGYDEFFGNYGGALDYFSHRGTGDAQTAPKDLYEDEVPVERAGYYTNILADRAVDYLRRKRTNPFLLSLHFTAPHWPWEGPGDAAISRRLKDIRHTDGGNLATYAQMMRALDDSVGRVIGELDAKGLRDDTIVVFTSDNGGERFSDNWPLSGQKGELLEGGIRVPAIVRWPGHVSPGTSDQVAITMDWLPTLLDVANAKTDPTSPPDGHSLLRVLTTDRSAHARTLYWRYGFNAQRAMRRGNMKYLKIRESEYLFDLSSDVRERANLAELQPDTLGELRDQWEKWNDAMLPIPSDAFTSGPTSRQQADRYFVPAPPR